MGEYRAYTRRGIQFVDVQPHRIVVIVSNNTPPHSSKLKKNKIWVYPHARHSTARSIRTTVVKRVSKYNLIEQMGTCYSTVSISDYEHVARDESHITEPPPSAFPHNSDTSSSEESTEFEIIPSPPNPRLKPAKVWRHYYFGSSNSVQTVRSRAQSSGP